MYTTSDLYDIASLYYMQAYISYLQQMNDVETRYICHDVSIASKLDKNECRLQLKDHKARYALRCLLYAIAGNMIYEGRF